MPFGFDGKKGSGRGKKWGRIGRGREAGGPGRGFPTDCVCPQCGLTVPHEPGIPCFQRKCPQCGAFMARQFLKID